MTGISSTPNDARPGHHQRRSKSKLVHPLDVVPTLIYVSYRNLVLYHLECCWWNLCVAHHKQQGFSTVWSRSPQTKTSEISRDLQVILLGSSYWSDIPVAGGETVTNSRAKGQRER